MNRNSNSAELLMTSLPHVSKLSLN